MRTVTQWFKFKQKPVHLGVYQVKIIGRGAYPFYAYWDGKGFGQRHITALDAFEWKEFRTNMPPSAQWRGLAEKPA